MRLCIERFNAPTQFLPFRSWPDCITNTSGYDFRKGQVAYEFDAPLGVRNPTTLWDFYRETLRAAEGIVYHGEVTQAAYRQRRL